MYNKISNLTCLSIALNAGWMEGKLRDQGAEMMMLMKKMMMMMIYSCDLPDHVAPQSHAGAPLYAVHAQQVLLGLLVPPL